MHQSACVFQIIEGFLPRPKLFKTHKHFGKMHIYGISYVSVFLDKQDVKYTFAMHYSIVPHD